MSLARRCPLCDGNHGRPVWHEQALRYIRCSRCGAVFSDVDAATYAAAAHNVWDESGLSADARSFYGTARELAHERLLERFPPAGARRLLDVGCGLGYFMRAAADRGWEAYGCDTSEHWLARAAVTTGAAVRLAQAEPHANLFGGGFDLITAWDVLEHVHAPLPFLTAVAALLAPGGRIFIRTPNITWIYPTYLLRRRMLHSDVSLGPLNHVVYFSASTLSRALTAAGLRAQAWPVLPPPQVGLANREPQQAGERSAVTLLKNVHAAGAERLAKASAGRCVVGADLDVVAVAS